MFIDECSNNSIFDIYVTRQNYQRICLCHDIIKACRGVLEHPPPHNFDFFYLCFKKRGPKGRFGQFPSSFNAHFNTEFWASLIPDVMGLIKSLPGIATTLIPALHDFLNWYPYERKFCGFLFRGWPKWLFHRNLISQFIDFQEFLKI